MNHKRNNMNETRSLNTYLYFDNDFFYKTGFLNFELC